MVHTREFVVRFRGVRGSYPTPGSDTLRHGGNTSCIEVQVAGHTLIFDAGSGIINLGHELLQQHRTDGKPLAFTLFLTHGHTDHLLGFPFFAPLFDRRTRLVCFGPTLAGQTVEQVITPLMSPPYFPVDIHDLPSTLAFHTITDKQCIIWRYGENEPELVSKDDDMRNVEICVRVNFSQHHPLDGSALYRIEYAGRSMVYATDVEWNEAGEYDPEFVAFAWGADLLIHDAQYTTNDYHQAKQGFGHSTVAMATGAANAAHVGQLVLFHHEPTYDDARLDSMEAEARIRFAATRSAYEGLEIDLLAPETIRGL